ncbi:hypothetical protein K505DRAFT_365368 [Melanomma pulvis-pyrius CBS 109.77]|uniref:Uncharacterized protein n=1 Tax=Melanomma pulvis-pyrius CBS 109.77 TaxID=1314802 RepID=A0A6A6X0P6_9PLEO|nr:hypothetical protein K505DRAFT_365368 [Melanomma pulvis-pyrius CBS 109.77]
MQLIRSLQGHRKGKSHAIAWTCLSVIPCLTAIVLGIVILINCMTPALGSFYLAELHKNDTYDANFQIGYLGGCVSITNVIDGPGIGANDSSDALQAYCVANMRGFDEDDLSEEFWDDMNLADPALDYLKDFPNTTIPLTRHLQKDVFNYAALIAHIVLFIVSAIMLAVAAMAGSSIRRSYKSVVFVAVSISAFALALALDTTVCSKRSLNALVNVNKNMEGQALQQPLQDVFLQRAGTLGLIQGFHMALVSIFYAVMGTMFTLR